MPDPRPTPRQLQLLYRAFVKYSDGYMEAWLVGHRCGRSESAARSALVKLEKRGFVECEEPAPFKWSITDAGREAVERFLEAGDA